ncbi:tRNA preQ1(34) S-adenosylmethionine ribosyltransferase-isomerase QueA [Planctomicrobium piriforme]|uniref:S-adenosylmethionine:tRNA ribosyltransferase-isomerase n=1 Tax=Planctomicrobium piriforme TaxID=1576369 RepID=A0A1I3G850_9PLAN|nr:tRNA preQ1(34) S-adenosylmethionine ribosyltransferase-isomerase QueA [Planctomicrobium piriforme]SFI19678.1 S-adenosylmethionine:tRNA ribosyltransferase-isomerase [Planctomicrobium piriforme]
MLSLDQINAYDYSLPEELIAQVPAERRDESRLLVVNRQSGSISHHRFRDLPELLRPHDLLVLNDTRVVPARLIGHRAATGGKWEGLFLRLEDDGAWRLIGQTRGTLRAGERLTLSPADPNAASPASQLDLILEARNGDGTWRVRPDSEVPAMTLLEQFGTLPLPHYMQRDAEIADRDRYQTTYAEKPGAVAAPTAGLHFTPEVFAACQTRQIETAHVTLHVGLGTFRPVSVDNLSEHRMHSEWCELSVKSAQQIADTKATGGRIVAVGTTSVRTLESVAQQGQLRAWQGETNLFIRPPFQFQIVDALITNFHLPRSTLLVLVCTFAGRELMLAAYEEAIRERYRFFSYGDAMLIV